MKAATAGVRAENTAHQAKCEVYCSGTDQVLGYLVVGGTASCLEKALTENGFRLVPIGSRESDVRESVAA